MNTYRLVTVVAVVATLAALPATVRAQCAGGAAPVGNIGIALLECDCVLVSPASDGQTRFWTEPRILRVERGGPAEGALQVDDVIVSVDGQTVTSPEGARALARPVPSRQVTLTVRRDGQLKSVAIAPTAACPSDARLLGAVAPLAPGATSVQRSETARGVRLRALQASAATADAANALVAQTRAATLVPTQIGAWIGLAFNCGDCTVRRWQNETRWTFGSSPEVYSVEQGSPAYTAGIRRGDVLTHVDGHALTSDEGGRRWAALKPGDAARVTYRRDGQTRSVMLRPAELPSRVAAVEAEAVQLNALRASVATSDAATERLVRQYQATITQQQVQQDELLRQLTQRQAGNAEERQAVERIVRQYAARDSTLRSAQQQQLQALLRQREAEAVTLQALTTVRGSAPSTVTTRGLVPLMRADVQRLRYSGTFAGSDIEVRGVDSVIVTEQGNELIITTRDATIRIRRPDRN